MSMSSWDVAAVHIALSGSCICERASAETRHTHNANCKAVPAAATALRRDVNSEHALGSARLYFALPLPLSFAVAVAVASLEWVLVSETLSSTPRRAASCAGVTSYALGASRRAPASSSSRIAAFCLCRTACAQHSTRTDQTIRVLHFSLVLSVCLC